MILASIFAHEFMLNAFIAGGAVALGLGVVGYFVVLRGEVFAGDALSHVAFTGSLAALAFGVNQRIGLFAGTVLVALLLGAFNTRRLGGDVAIGTTFSWLLGVGALFLYIFTTHHSTSNANAGPNILFGSIFGINHTQVVVAVLISLAVLIATAVIARPLVFASIDQSVARANGVRVRIVTFIFVILLSLQIAEAVQLVGSLLLLGLLASPAAAGARLSTNPFSGMALSAGICVLCVWAGLAISYAAPSLPASFVIIALAFAVYLGATVRERLLI